jgi:Domain of unknown function (DUF4440)
MADVANTAEVSSALERINRAWLDGRPSDLVPLLHPGITMVVPGFAGRVHGRDAFVSGFEDFCTNAKVHEYREADLQVDVTGDTAVANFTYEMVYERDAKRYRATGRDLWVFARQDGQWIAVWRTMLDPAEEPA